ncbi:MAG: hypothetical protein H7Y01_03420 [Ferruginibacter sp.]|nr:hypothetical protein [Chitinophagaceae bacterium]
MKKIITCIVLLISVITLPSCKDKKSDTKSDTISVGNVPAPVQSAFSAKYSTAAAVEWEDAHENEIQTYKAKFTLGGKKMKAEFDAKGGFVKEKVDD